MVEFEVHFRNRVTTVKLKNPAKHSWWGNSWNMPEYIVGRAMGYGSEPFSRRMDDRVGKCGEAGVWTGTLGGYEYKLVDAKFYVLPKTKRCSARKPRAKVKATRKKKK